MDRERAIVFGGLLTLGVTLHALGMPLAKAVLSCILGFLGCVLLNPYHRWRVRRLPGPPYRPLLGNLPEFMALGSHAFFEQCRALYGDVFVVWFGARPWVVVADAELGRKVNFKLINRPASFANPLARGEAARAVKEGLFLARDGVWAQLRRAWQPAFHSDSLAGYAPLMAAEACRLAGRLREAADSGARVDMRRELGDMTMGVVGTTAYGVDFGLLHDDDGGNDGTKASPPPSPLSASASPPSSPPPSSDGARLVRAAAEMFQSSEIGQATRYLLAAHLVPLLTPLIALVAQWLPDARYRRLIDARETLRATSQALIDETRRHNSNNGAGPARLSDGSDGSGGSDGGKKKRPTGVAPGSFLGLLMAARDADGHALADRQMAAQANVFTLAGYETTANALAYAVHCLAAHPEAAARLRAEVDALPGPRARALTPADAPALRYTRAVVDEALRLYPPGASTMREAQGGLVLGNHRIPDGATVMVATYSIQRDARYWPKAGEFRPERWLGGAEGAGLAPSTPDAYLPFGAGARLCIGYRYALQEACLALARLYREFDFELEPGQVPLAVRTGITMSPANGVWVRVKRAAAAGAMSGAPAAVAV